MFPIQVNKYGIFKVLIKRSCINRAKQLVGGNCEIHVTAISAVLQFFLGKSTMTHI